MTTPLWTAAGAALILAGLREIFHQLFHPSGEGALSEWVMRGGFKGVRAVSLRSGAGMVLAGPLGVALTLITWGLLLALGWALVYLPHLPGAFRFGAGLDPSAKDGFGTALYLSLVTLATLGYGDISPAATWLRLLAPLEALMGFTMLSAGVTWVLSLYPSLLRQRALAHQVHLLVEAGLSDRAGLRRLGELPASELLRQLAWQVVTARQDLLSFSAAKYFHGPDERSSLACAARKLERISQEGQEASLPEPVRLQARVLEVALDDFAATISRSLLRRGPLPRHEALRAYERFHRPSAGEGES